MTIKVTQKALWTPRWYELDQSLVVGQRQRFWFYINPPLERVEETFDLVFFNQMTSTTNSQIRYARVVDIEHPEFGPLQRVDSDGLDYIFYPVSGNEVVVNAEEDPGAVCDDSELRIKDWSVTVTLNDVSHPLVEVV